MGGSSVTSSSSSCLGGRATLLVALMSLGTVICSSAQAISLPVFLATFSGLSGPYFVLFICSATFTLVFGLDSIRLQLQKKIARSVHRYTGSFRGHFFLFLTGFFDAMNGFMLVYASPASRVPPSLQPIFLQATIPFSLIFSKLILRNRTYNWKQYVGGIIVLGGILFSISEDLNNLATGHADTRFESGMWWAIIIVGACIPAVLMNIIEEKIFEDVPKYNVTYLLAWESFYQLLVVAAFFWMDILPHYGTNKNVRSFGKAFEDGFGCVFNPTAYEDRQPKCRYAAPYFVLFAGAYIGTYVFGSYLFKWTSANYNALLSTLANPIATAFWYIFPSVYRWTSPGAKQEDKYTFAFTIGALPLILLGAVLFRMFENGKKEKLARLTADEGEDELGEEGSSASHAYAPLNHDGNVEVLYSNVEEDDRYGANYDDPSKALLGNHQTRPHNTYGTRA